MGTTPIAWNIPKTDTSTLNVNLGGYRPSVGSEVAGSLASIGTMLTMGILSNAIQGKATDKSGNKQPADGQANAIQQQITDGQQKIENLKIENTGYDNVIKELTPKTDETEIKTKEESVKKLHDELFSGANKDIVSKLTTQESTIKATQTEVTKLTNEASTLDKEISDLQTTKGNAEVIVNAGEKQSDKQTFETAQNTLKDIDQKIKTKTEEQTKKNEALAKAKGKLTTEQGKLTELQTQNTEVQSKLTTYNQENTELQELNNALATNKKSIGDASAKKAANEANIKMYEGVITGLQNKLMNQKGAQIKQDGTDAKDYSKGDANDGNWFSRTFGSKSTRTSQKEAHKQKEAAITDYMQSHNCSESEANAALNKNSTANEQSQTNKFFAQDGNGYYVNMKTTVLEFFKANPDKSIAEAKTYLDGIIKKANP